MHDTLADDRQRFQLRPLRVREIIEEFLRYVEDHRESIMEDTPQRLDRVTQTRGWLRLQKASSTEPDPVTASVLEVWPCF